MTVEMFKAGLRAQGKTIGQWADENGFDRLLVYRTLSGVLKGHFGTSHNILVAAGIKSTTPDSLAA
ncbi:MAG: DNA-binding protein [Thiobacillus sp.]|uniref:DNA-binding protein n=1 Tax=Thiobacillus sp. TaxID=924 RepID=UPI002895E977|nr:DNA-binding protein [Thiobacillus sp.]MDT3707466.1 DNA-binding protein [Thiobacillus sp.]